MKEEKFTGRAILAAAASAGIWGLISLLYSLIILGITVVCFANLDVLGDNAVGIVFLVGILSCFVSYGLYRLSKFVMQKMCKNTPTTALAFRIFGWFLIIIGIADFFISASNSTSTNIWLFLYGYLLLRQSKKMRNSLNEELIGG